MKFVDKVSITVEAGKGGPGAASFRREKYVDKGGPDGGNGGDGGNVIFSATNSLQTLLDLKINRYYKAQNGLPGRGKKQFGQKGKDTIILVPCGTKIFNEDNNEVADLTNKNGVVALQDFYTDSIFIQHTSYKSKIVVKSQLTNNIVLLQPKVE